MESKPHRGDLPLSGGLVMSQQSVVADVERPELQFQGTTGPDKKLWKYYSPHHELPFSSISSLALHVAAIAILIVGGILASRWSRSEAVVGLPISVMNEPSDNIPRSPDSPPASEPIQPREDVGPGLSPRPGVPPSGLPRGERLDQPSAAAPAFPSVPPASKERLIEGANAATTTLSNLSNRLGDAIRRSPPDGSKDGTPGGTGAPGALGSIRDDRVRRWQVNFTVAGPEDHLRQFAGLGAILAVPDSDGRYHVYRELSRQPLVGRVEDISKINRIWFIDAKAETVAAIARLLGLPGQPTKLIAFFPQKLEQEMATLEDDLYPGRNKANKKIVFQVVRRGDGYRVKLAEPQP
jgi:hypothetical protein